MNISRRTFSRRLLLTLSLLAMVGIVAANLGSLARVDAQKAQQTGESHGFPTQSKSLDSVPGEILVRFRSGSAIAKSKERSAVSIEENDGQIPVHVESLSQGPEIVDGLRICLTIRTSTRNMLYRKSALRRLGRQVRDRAALSSPSLTKALTSATRIFRGTSGR